MHDASSLQLRTKQLAIAVAQYCRTLPRDMPCSVIARQLLRSALSVAANYRAACRAHSRAGFIAKLSIVEEEADESVFWLEILAELGYGNPEQRASLRNEASQIAAMIVASKRTARKNQPTR